MPELKDYNAALNTNTKDAQSWAMRGLAYEKINRRKEALESYQQAQRLDQGNLTAKQGLSRLM